MSKKVTGEGTDLISRLLNLETYKKQEQTILIISKKNDHLFIFLY